MFYVAPLDYAANSDEILAVEMSQYSFDVSYPTKCRPVLKAATALVPVPMNGSITTSPANE